MTNSISVRQTLVVAFAAFLLMFTNIAGAAAPSGSILNSYCNSECTDPLGG